VASALLYGLVTTVVHDAPREARLYGMLTTVVHDGVAAGTTFAWTKVWAWERSSDSFVTSFEFEYTATDVASGIIESAQFVVPVTPTQVIGSYTTGDVQTLADTELSAGSWQDKLEARLAYKINIASESVFDHNELS